MKIGSHNSFTYLPVRQWWLKPFAFVARCQRVNYEEQINLGVTLFDLRIRFDKDDMPIICHGTTEYKHDYTFIQDFFKYCQKVGGISVRVVLELNEKNTYQEILFREFCASAAMKYSNIYFFGGNNRTDWDCQHPIYNFKHEMPSLTHRYSSSTSLFTSASYILRKIDDWIPIYYAKRFNKYSLKRELLDKDAYLFIDFVDIR